MKNKIKSFFVFMMLIFTISSCDEFLTQTDPSSTPVEEFFENLADAEQVLTSVYTCLRNEALLNLRNDMYRADLAYPGYGRGTNTIGGYGSSQWELYTHTYNSSTSSIQNHWEALYEGIFRANQTIRGLNLIYETATSESDRELWLTLMAQARLFRGWFHFCLHTGFNNGEIPIIENVPITLEDSYVSCSSSEDVIAFFRKDLLYAYENLPIEYDDSDDLGRVTSGFAASLLGKSYLYNYSATGDTGELDLAMEMFRYVIYDCNYSLVQDGNMLYNENYEWDSETLFEINYSTTVQSELTGTYKFYQSISQYTQSYSNGHHVPSWIAIEYQSESIDPLNERNLYEQFYEDDEGNRTSEMLVRNFPLRASAMVAMYKDIYTPWNTYNALCMNGANSLGVQNCGFAFYKKHDTGKTQSYKETYSGVNVVVCRLAEVYLNYAECLIEKGDIQAALDIININRERWGLVLLGPDKGDGFTYNNLPYDKESLLTHFRGIEKPLETCFEGYQTRWADLRRWGIIESNLAKISTDTYYGYTVTSLTMPDPDDTPSSYPNTTTSPIPQSAAQYLLNPLSTISLTSEYDGAAANYKAESHAYWPIPMSEVESNPNLYN